MYVKNTRPSAKRDVQKFRSAQRDDWALRGAKRDDQKLIIYFSNKNIFHRLMNVQNCKLIPQLRE